MLVPRDGRAPWRRNSASSPSASFVAASSSLAPPRRSWSGTEAEVRVQGGAKGGRERGREEEGGKEREGRKSGEGLAQNPVFERGFRR